MTAVNNKTKAEFSDYKIQAESEMTDMQKDFIKQTQEFQENFENHKIKINSRQSEYMNEISKLEKTVESLKKQSKTKRIGNIEFIEIDRLGTGSSGNIVFKGKLLDGADGRVCAIKKMPINKEDKDADGQVKDLVRAKKETQIMKSFSHDNLIKYYDSRYDEVEGYFYIAMQYCHSTLDAFIENNTHVSMRKGSSTNLEILDIIKQITEAIDYLHNGAKNQDGTNSGFSNVAHRDLKPQNILVGEKNAGRRDWVVVLADFGLSREMTEAKATKNMPASTTGNHGTEGWRPPKFMDKSLDSKSDIFTLGLLFHYCIAGDYSRYKSVKKKLKSGNSLMIENWDETSIRLNYSTCLEASHLTQLMLVKNALSRPSSKQILRHPTFWSGTDKLKFIEEVNSKVTVPKRANLAFKNLPAIEKALRSKFNINWQLKIPVAIKREIKNRHNGNFDTYILDLLRLIRNHSSHRKDVKTFNSHVNAIYKSHSPKVINSLDVEAGFDDYKYLSYWTQKNMFPSLIIDVWTALEPWKHELDLDKFYVDD